MAKPPDPGKPKPNPREAKLAQALRANLRRRKAGAEARPTKASPTGRPKPD
jgi:hypothetical protein